MRVISFAIVALAGAASTLRIVRPRHESSLRLIKTGPTDPGKWMVEEETDKLLAENVQFVDITDITDPDVLAIFSSSTDELRQRVNRRAISYPTKIAHKTEVVGLVNQIDVSKLRGWTLTMTEFWNRHYKSTTGTAAATWMFNTVKDIAKGNSKIVVTQFSHSGFDQPSVIARVPGKSSSLVVVGAHFDSTGGSASARGPGADDNASAVAALLGALSILANNPYSPNPTVEFHFYAGEEGGLRGSMDIWNTYKRQGKTVLAFLNQDMAGYSPSGKVSVYQDYDDDGLSAWMRVLATGYVGGYTEDRCGYGCSDHASAYANGFPTAYVCDEPMDTAFQNIHSSRDSFDIVDFETVKRHSAFTLAFLVEASYLS